MEAEMTDGWQTRQVQYISGVEKVFVFSGSQKNSANGVFWEVNTNKFTSVAEMGFVSF